MDPGTWRGGRSGNETVEVSSSHNDDECRNGRFSQGMIIGLAVLLRRMEVVNISRLSGSTIMYVSA